MGRKSEIWGLASSGLLSQTQATALDGDSTARLETRASVADANAEGGSLVVFRVALASGADANVDVAMVDKVRLVDAVVVLKGAGTAGSDVTVYNVTTAWSDTIDVSAGSDTDVFRPSTMDDAQHEVAAGANLRVGYTSTGGDFPGAEVYITAMKVA